MKASELAAAWNLNSARFACWIEIECIAVLAAFAAIILFILLIRKLNSLHS